MLTIDSLRAFGANVDEGLGRCMKNESFYLRMVRMGCADANFEKLAQAVGQNDLNAAFEAAPALKGVMANLALPPIAAPVAELTELLRVKIPGDYREDVKKILAARDSLKALDE